MNTHSAHIRIHSNCIHFGPRLQRFTTLPIGISPVWYIRTSLRITYRQRQQNPQTQRTHKKAISFSSSLVIINEQHTVQWTMSRQLLYWSNSYTFHPLTHMYHQPHRQGLVAAYVKRTDSILLHRHSSLSPDCFLLYSVAPSLRIPSQLAMHRRKIMFLVG